MFDDVLLPTEANPGSREAIDLAVDLAARYGATLHVLFVVEDVERPRTRVPTEERLQELPSDGKAAIEEVEAAARDANVTVEPRVGTGEPEFSITQHIGRISADFVVMGTHGRSGVERILVGSVAEKVVREADVPVLVVPLDEKS